MLLYYTYMCIYRPYVYINNSILFIYALVLVRFDRIIINIYNMNKIQSVTISYIKIAHNYKETADIHIYIYIYIYI